MKPTNGGPAFLVNDNWTHGRHGMTLRDYFAAKALPECIRELWGQGDDVPDMAQAAYQIADAMLAERSKE